MAPKKKGCTEEEELTALYFSVLQDIEGIEMPRLLKNRTSLSRKVSYHMIFARSFSLKAVCWDVASSTSAISFNFLCLSRI